MTVSYNVHMGLVSWVSNTSYTLGNRVLNFSNCYQCIVNGKSALVGGPVGIANNIIDGSITWKYVSTVDYSGNTGDVVFTAAQNALPATFTQNIIWQLWNSNNGKPIQTSAVGKWFLFLQGHTIPPYSLTMTPAPGESFRDALFLNKTPAFTANSQLGLTFQLPSTGQGIINYFEIHDDNVIIDGIQFIDPLIYSQSSILTTYANNTTVQYCIFDGNGQNNGATIIGAGVPGTNVIYKNCLIIDRQIPGAYPAEPGTSILLNGVANYLYNCGILSYKSAGNTAEAIRSDRICWANNCYVFGYTWSNFSANLYIKNVVTDYPSVPGGIDLGGGQYSVNAATCFVSYPNKLDVLDGSPLIQHSTSIPGDTQALDLARNYRPTSQNWDVGPLQFEFNTLTPGILRITYS